MLYPISGTAWICQSKTSRDKLRALSPSSNGTSKCTTRALIWTSLSMSLRPEDPGADDTQRSRRPEPSGPGYKRPVLPLERAGAQQVQVTLGGSGGEGPVELLQRGELLFDEVGVALGQSLLEPLEAV